VVYSSEAGIYLEWVFFIEKILAEMISLSHEKYIPVKVKFPVSPKILDIEIGHSAFLRSVDPSVMIIARSTNSPNTAPDGGRTSGPNKEPKLEPPNEFAGFMSKGIWININALSEAFLTTQTFTEGMNKLLGMMNNASGDVWNLNLIYDDHNQNYYIVDLNFNPFPEKEVKFYKFNEKSKSELLGLTFNANLTNEQRAQVFISSVGSVSTDKRFALLNNTIFRHFSNTLEDLNLKDSVNAELDQRGTISQPITPDVYNELNSVNLQISEAKQLVPDADYTLGAARSPGIPLGYVLTGPLAGFTNSPASGQFGASRDGGVRSHLGIDLLAKEGTKVLALSDGVVLSSSATGLDPIGGNFIKLVHPALGNITSNYMHLQSVPTLPVNARVLRGDVIGIVGRTGNAPSAPAPAELHLQVKTAAGQPEDPTVLINSVMAGRSPAEIKNLVLDEASKEAALSSVYRDLISATAKRDSLFLEASARNATAPDALAVNNPAMAHKPSSARPTATSSALIAADVARIDKIKALLDDKFGILIRGYIEYDASVMKKRIAREGLDDLSKPNSFTAPKMTDIEVSLVLKGISGLSPGDGFQIDKILRSYERSGVFQITGIEDAISVEAGWVIRIAALYKILIRRPETTVAFGGGGGFHAGSGGGTTF
jgi:murein DD-endopeptidase MepM/ murein hydrolase activator NlpD